MTENENPLYYELDQIRELARLITVAADEHCTPNWALELIRKAVTENQTIDAEWLRVMAERWRECGAVPADFASEVERLADAVSRNEEQ